MKIRNLFTTMVRWFDTGAPGAQAVEPRVDMERFKQIDWVRCLPFIAFHLMCLAAFWVGVSPVAIVACAVLYFVRMFAITGIYHRYFSHKTYHTSRVVQFLFAILGNSSVQRGPLWWAAHHRNHHLYSDTEKDVHSPKIHGFWWAHVGWITSKKNFPTDYKVIPDFAKYPELVFLNRFDILVPVLLGTSMFFWGVYLDHVHPELGTNGMQMLVWGFFISTVLLFHGTFTINSLAHLFGRQRFNTGDDSRNSFILSLITLGEGWHNNHHHYQVTVRQGFYWWELDVTYYVLVVLSWMGIVWDLRPVPDRVLESTIQKQAERGLLKAPVSEGTLV